MKTFTLFFIILGFTSLAAGEVVQSFEKSCPDFFMRDPQNQNKPFIPTIFEGEQYKQICQRWKNVYRFATLYDTVNRIPVYSAYTYYEPKMTTDRKNVWKIEPQLDEAPNEANKEMRNTDKEKENKKGEKIISQALLKDYNFNEMGYTRGHVFPKSYAKDQEQADSTFSLTNIAPQTEESNGAWAKHVEEPMLKEIKTTCDLITPTYIVTGVVPGAKWIKIKRGEKEIEYGVNIPSYYWSAYFCTNSGKTFSKAYLARQGTPDKEIQFEAKIMTADVLNEELVNLYKLQKKDLFIFPRNKIMRKNSAPF